MERKMARFTAFFTCAFSLFICVAVWFLPELEQRIEAYSASIRRDQLAREERYALLEKMSGLEIMDYNTQQVQQQAEKAEKEEKEIIKEGGDPEPQEDVIVITHQMQLELPSGADASNVEVVHDLIERRIDIPSSSSHLKSNKIIFMIIWCLVKAGIWKVLTILARVTVVRLP